MAHLYSPFSKTKSIKFMLFNQSHRIVLTFIFLCVYINSVGQERRSEIVFDFNTPASIQLEPFPYSKPLGLSISFKKPLKNKLLIGTSISYDNFKYNATGKRSGEFIQARIGLTQNEITKSNGGMTTYFVLEFGAVYKSQNRLTSSRVNFAFANGFGIRQSISKNSFVNFLILANNIHEPSFSNSWCINFKFGYGVYFGH